MIVKNEAHIIVRALESVRSYIDYWVICDTGSADNTPAIIRETLAGIDGELHVSSWKNFGENRNEVIRLAKGKADYLLVLDADMTVQVRGPFKQKLQLDYYQLRYAGDIDYCQPMLISNQHAWQYKGITHEYIHSDTAESWDFLPELELVHHGDGGCRSDKFERDVRLLTEGLVTEPGNSRYLFYLAQSYKDLGQWEQALVWYEQRIAAVGWEEERWYAMYQAARMKEQAGYAWGEVLSAYHAALDARPQRLETLYSITKHYVCEEQYAQGYLYSAIALQGLKYPVLDTLFIERAVYEYLLLLEHITCALACGRITESIKGANMILRRRALPEPVYRQAIQIRSAAGDLLPGKRNPQRALSYHLVVIVPFYNTGNFLRDCIRTLLQQDYEDFEVIFIDDASTDGNKDFVPPPTLPSRLIRNKERQGGAFNIHHAITTYCDPASVVVCLDGDDRLASATALSTIARLYRESGCWVMYGQYENSDGTKGISAPFASPDDFSTLRKNWRSSHIKTFRAGLFMKIAEQDPGYTCLKDENGEWLFAAVDAAIMYPLLEMAGFYRVWFNEEVLYIYTLENKESWHHRGQQQQIDHFDRLKGLRPFATVMELELFNIEKELV